MQRLKYIDIKLRWLQVGLEIWSEIERGWCHCLGSSGDDNGNDDVEDVREGVAQVPVKYQNQARIMICNLDDDNNDKNDDDDERDDDN